MSNSLDTIASQVAGVTSELMKLCDWKQPKLLVIGASTSEVAGHRIGTNGATEIASSIFKGLQEAAKTYAFIPVFQCCEHLNRALVIETEVAERLNLTIVKARPVPTAGGAMAAYAFTQLHNPCLVEEVNADAGIDIGDTLIGMHLKRVAVPFRASIRTIGEAHLTLAYTRPKLIGGERAIYE